MQQRHTQNERALKIVQEIQQNHYPTAKSLSNQIEVCEKTIQRDIEFLRNRAGAPIEFDHSKNGYYFTETTWTLPAGLATIDDLRTLMIAEQSLIQYRGLPIADELHKVYQKMTETLSGKWGIKPADIEHNYSFIPAPSLKINPDVWEAINQGMKNQQVVEVTYASKRSAKQRHGRIHPYHIFTIQSDWYVFAFVEGPNTIRSLA